MIDMSMAAFALLETRCQCGWPINALKIGVVINLIFCIVFFIMPTQCLLLSCRCFSF